MKQGKIIRGGKNITSYTKPDDTGWMRYGKTQLCKHDIPETTF